MTYVPPQIAPRRTYVFAMNVSVDSLEDLAAILRDVQAGLSIGRTDVSTDKASGNYSLTIDEPVTAERLAEFARRSVAPG